MDFSQFDLTDPFVRRALAETLAEDNGLDYQDEYIRKALNDEIAAAAAPKPIDGERNFFGDTVSRLARGGVQLADTAIHAVDTAVGGSETLQGWSGSLDRAKQNVGLLRPDKSEHEDGWLKRSYGQALESAPMSAVPWAGAMAGASMGAVAGPAGAVAGGLIGGTLAMGGLFGLGTYGQRKEEVERELTATRPDLTPDEISKMAHDNAKNHAFAETGGESAGDLASWAILSKVPGGQAIFKGGKAVLAELVKPNAFKAIALGIGKSMPFEVGSEVGTAIWQNEADKAIGVEQGTSTDAALAAIGPALFLSAGMGVAVGGYSANQRRVQYNALNSEDQESRAQAVDQVAGTLAEATDQQTAKKWRDMALGFVQNGQPIPLDMNLAELSANEPEVAAPEAQDQPAETILKAESVDEAIQEAEAEIAKPGWLAPTAPDLEAAAQSFTQAKEEAPAAAGLLGQAMEQPAVTDIKKTGETTINIGGKKQQIELFLGKDAAGKTVAMRRVDGVSQGWSSISTKGRGDGNSPSGETSDVLDAEFEVLPSDPLTEVLTTISTADQPTLLQMADGLPGLVEGSPELAPYQRQLSEAITERQRILWEESNVGRGKVSGYQEGVAEVQPGQPAGGGVLGAGGGINGAGVRVSGGAGGTAGEFEQASPLLTAARQHVAETGDMTMGGLAMALDVDIDTAEKLLEQVKATTPLPRNIGGTQAATVGADAGGFLNDQAIRKTGATSPATTAGDAQGFIADQGIRKAAGAVTAATVAGTEEFVRDQQIRRDAMGRGPKPTRAADEPARAFLARKREWEKGGARPLAEEMFSAANKITGGGAANPFVLSEKGQVEVMSRAAKEIDPRLNTDERFHDALTSVGAVGRLPVRSANRKLASAFSSILSYRLDPESSRLEMAAALRGDEDEMARLVDKNALVRMRRNEDNSEDYELTSLGKKLLARFGEIGAVALAEKNISVSSRAENETQADLPRTDETQAGDQGGGQGEYDYDLSAVWRGRAPQVAAPTVLKSTTGGKEYAIPGLEELRVTVKPPSGNKAKHTKLGWSVYVGDNLVWANLPGVADTAENAINTARGKLKRIHAAIAKDQAHTTPKTTSTSDLPGVGTETAPSPGEASNVAAEMKKLVASIKKSDAKLEKLHEGQLNRMKNGGQSRATSTTYAARSGNEAKHRDGEARVLANIARAELRAGRAVPQDVLDILGSKIEYNRSGDYEPIEGVTAPSPGEASNIKATAGGENGETLRRGEEGTADYGTTTNGAGGQKNTARGGAAGPGRAADVDQPQREQWELTAAEWEKAHARDRRLEREAIEKVDRLKRQPRPKSVSANLRYLEKISAAEKVLREASENADRWGGEAVRKEVVRRAYESGKPVPSVILAEFPELSPPAAQPSASKATPEKPAGVATSGQRLPADYDPASDEERFYGSKVTIKEQRARNGKVFRKETTGRVDRVLKGSSGGNVFEVVPDGYEDAFRYDEGDIVIDELVDNQADKKDEVAPVKSGRPSPGKFVPASKEYNSTAQGQKDMSARGSRIAMLKGLNRAVGKVYTDGEIESAADENIDAIRDYLIERQRQEQAAKEPDWKREQASLELRAAWEEDADDFIRNHHKADTYGWRGKSDAKKAYEKYSEIERGEPKVSLEKFTELFNARIIEADAKPRKDADMADVPETDFVEMESEQARKEREFNERIEAKQKEREEQESEEKRMGRRGKEMERHFNLRFDEDAGQTDKQMEAAIDAWIAGSGDAPSRIFGDSKGNPLTGKTILNSSPSKSFIARVKRMANEAKRPFAVVRRDDRNGVPVAGFIVELPAWYNERRTSGDPIILEQYFFDRATNTVLETVLPDEANRTGFVLPQDRAAQAEAASNEREEGETELTVEVGEEIVAIEEPAKEETAKQEERRLERLDNAGEDMLIAPDRERFAVNRLIKTNYKYDVSRGLIPSKADFPSIDDSIKRTVALMKKFVATVPEFKEAPVFTVVEDTENGTVLRFSDSYTYDFRPQVFGLSPQELKAGDRVRLDLDAWTGKAGAQETKFVNMKMLGASGWVKYDGKVWTIDTVVVAGTPPAGLKVDDKQGSFEDVTKRLVGYFSGGEQFDAGPHRQVEAGGKTIVEIGGKYFSRDQLNFVVTNTAKDAKTTLLVADENMVAVAKDGEIVAVLAGYRDEGEEKAPAGSWTAKSTNKNPAITIPLAGAYARKVSAQTTSEKGAETASSEAEKSDVSPRSHSTPIADFGEKIGGARKDSAERGYTRSAGKEKKATGWRAQFQVAENTITPGEWMITDTKSTSRFGNVLPQKFASKEEAERAVPVYAVAKSFDVRVENDGTFAIYKRVGDRKRLRMVQQSFATREEAMRHMATNAEALLDAKTTFGEEILPVPEIATRKGPERRSEDATPELFNETFAPRAIEFGNWNNQEERQQVLNHAYDGLLDLAEVLGVPPKALMLNGELAIAFGARGQGLVGAKAHYERDYGVINLTKMKGAGSLAHEWFHALDHYLARQDGKSERERKKNERGDMVYPASGPLYDYLSHGPSMRKSGVRPELQQAYDKLIDTMFKRAEQYVGDTEKAEKFVGAAKRNVREQLDRIREDIAKDRSGDAAKNGGWKRSTRGLAPASAEQLAEFDRLADLLVEGGALELERRDNLTKEEQAKILEKASGRNRTAAVVKTMAWRNSNDALDGINSIYKAVRGRSGFSSGHDGFLDRIAGSLENYAARLKMFDEAKGGVEKTRKRPTNYAIEARKMDQARVGDYWSTPHEMAARAFAAYVEDKVSDAGWQSDFIVYRAHGGIILPMIDGFVARPYPEGDERAALKTAFDRFTKELKVKETDKGVALFSTTALPPSARADIQGERPIKLSSGTIEALEQQGFKIDEKAWEDTDELAAAVNYAFEPIPWRLPNSLIGRDRKGRVEQAGTPRSDFELTERLAKIFNKRVIWTTFGEKETINGLVASNLQGRIFLNPLANNPSHVVFGHELSHWLELEHPAIYADLYEAVEPLIIYTEEYRKRFEHLRELSDYAVNTEIIGDLMGDAFADQKFWNLVAEQAGGKKFKGIVKKIIRWINSIVDRLAGLVGYNVHPLVKDLRKTKYALARAVARYGEASPKQERAAMGEGVRQSVRDLFKPVDTESAAFLRWFGESKVVDEKGSPLRVYHGTRQGGEEFSGDKKHRNFRSVKRGFFFTDDAEEANWYTEKEDWDYKKRKGDNPQIVPVFLSLESPLEITTDNDPSNYYDSKQSSILEKVKAGRHDGVIVRGDGATVYVAFKPTQIKSSISNTGDFSPSDPRIRYSKRFEADEADERNPPPLESTTTEDPYEQAAKIERNKYLALRRSTSATLKSIAGGVDKYLGAISTRLRKISPKLEHKIRQLDFNIGTNHTRDVRAVEPLLKLARQKMSKMDFIIWDLARKNSDVKRIDELVKKYGIRKEYDAYRKVLDRVFKEAQEVGIELGWINEYAPRVIKDPQGFLNELGRGNDWPVLTQKLKEVARRMDITVADMTPEMKADIISNMLFSGYYGMGAPGSTKERSIAMIPPNLNQYYMDSDAALMQYLHSMRKHIEARRFFGKVPQKISEAKRNMHAAMKRLREEEAKEIPNQARIEMWRDSIAGYRGVLEKYKNQRDYTDNIAQYVIDLMESGELSPENENVLKDILNARFNEHGTRGVIQAYKNFSYLDTMGSPISAITQIGDLAWSIYANGWTRTLRGISKSALGKAKITKGDVGIERIAQEFADTDTLSKAVAKVFRWIGLEKMDTIGKESFLNGAFERFVAEAKKDPKGLERKLEQTFEEDAALVVDDLQNERITENVKLLVYSDLLNFQPAAMSEMPEQYLLAGNGRLFYMLKTYTLKQFDVFRREGYNAIRRGTKTEKIDAIRKVAYLAMLLVLANGAADELKDWLLGRKTDLSDRVTDNVLRLFGVSKYMTWKARTEGYGSAIVRQILPPFKFVDSLSKDILSAGDGKGLQTPQSVPVVGKLAYWHLGRGKGAHRDLWEIRFSKERRRLEEIKERVEENPDLASKYRQEMRRLKAFRRAQYRINQMKSASNKLRQTERRTGSDYSDRIDAVEQRRIAAIKRFLGAQQ